MVAKVEANIGGIDVLVNNTAIAHPRKLEEITEAKWDEVLRVNLKSVFLVTPRSCSPALIPVGHFVSVDDVASVAVMLAMNDYMTGRTISVNGGWYIS